MTTMNHIRTADFALRDSLEIPGKMGIQERGHRANGDPSSTLRNNCGGQFHKLHQQFQRDTNKRAVIKDVPSWRRLFVRINAIRSGCAA